MINKSFSYDCWLYTCLQGNVCSTPHLILKFILLFWGHTWMFSGIIPGSVFRAHSRHMGHMGKPYGVLGYKLSSCVQCKHHTCCIICLASHHIFGYDYFFVTSVLVYCFKRNYLQIKVVLLLFWLGCPISLSLLIAVVMISNTLVNNSVERDLREKLSVFTRVLCLYGFAVYGLYDLERHSFYSYFIERLLNFL